MFHILRFHYLDTVGVGGSIPLAPTKKARKQGTFGCPVPLSGSGLRGVSTRCPKHGGCLPQPPQDFSEGGRALGLVHPEEGLISLAAAWRPFSGSLNATVPPASPTGTTRAKGLPIAPAFAAGMGTTGWTTFSMPRVGGTPARATGPRRLPGHARKPACWRPWPNPGNCGSRRTSKSLAEVRSASTSSRAGDWSPIASARRRPVRVGLETLEPGAVPTFPQANGSRELLTALPVMGIPTVPGIPPRMARIPSGSGTGSCALASTTVPCAMVQCRRSAR